MYDAKVLIKEEKLKAVSYPECIDDTNRSKLNTC